MEGTSQFVGPCSLRSFQFVENSGVPSTLAFHVPSSTDAKLSPYPSLGFQPPVSTKALSRRVSQLKVTKASSGPQKSRRYRYSVSEGPFCASFTTLARMKPRLLKTDAKERPFAKSSSLSSVRL